MKNFHAYILYLIYIIQYRRIVTLVVYALLYKDTNNIIYSHVYILNIIIILNMVYVILSAIIQKYGITFFLRIETCTIMILIIYDCTLYAHIIVKLGAILIQHEYCSSSSQPLTCVYILLLYMCI